MAKPKIIIAETNIDVAHPLQIKFAKEFFGKIDLEVITDETYFREWSATPRKGDILLIAEDLYDEDDERHDMTEVFILDEREEGNNPEEEAPTGPLDVHHVYKYSNVATIFNEIISKSSGSVQLEQKEKQETKVIVFTSASGGAGKTTAAVGISAALEKNFKRVLYINASHLQVFQHMLKDSTPIVAGDVYGRLSSPEHDVYSDIKHVIRKEIFDYLPPFKAALMSLSIEYKAYQRIVETAKTSGDYDFIIVDTDTTFDEEKLALLDIADKVMVVLREDKASLTATNILVSNISGVKSEKFIFICNDFVPDEDNALLSNRCQFTVKDYIYHFSHYDTLTVANLAQESSIKNAALLIM